MTAHIDDDRYGSNGTRKELTEMYALYAAAWPEVLADRPNARERRDHVARYDARLAGEPRTAATREPSHAPMARSQAARPFGRGSADCVACPA